MKALLIEDDKDLSVIISNNISNMFEVKQIYNGEEGLYMASQDIYDIIILDVMLPKLNGYEILKELRSSKIYTPVLMLTAKDSLEDKVKGLKLRSR